MHLYNLKMHFAFDLNNMSFEQQKFSFPESSSSILFCLNLLLQLLLYPLWLISRGSFFYTVRQYYLSVCSYPFLHLLQFSNASFFSLQIFVHTCFIFTLSFLFSDLISFFLLLRCPCLASHPRFIHHLTSFAPSCFPTFGVTSPSASSLVSSKAIYYSPFYILR